MADIVALVPLLPFVVAILVFAWVLRRATTVPMGGRAERRRDRFR